MPFSRRSFVQNATLTILAGSVIPSASAQTAATTKGEPLHFGNPISLKGVSGKSFEPLIGQNFTLTAADKPMGSLRLIAIEDLTPVSNPDSQRFMVGRVPVTSPRQPIACFALRFQGQEPHLPQDTYTLRNPRIGSIALFLVPSSDQPAPAKYTAFFSLLETE